jgi:magnesium-transporting ATPase (P-type)
MFAAKRKLVLCTILGFVALLIASLLSGIVMGYVKASGQEVADGKVALLIFGAFAVTVMVGAIVVGALWMRSIDEAAREAHKAAWYWGGSTGMAAGGVLMILTSLPQAATIPIPSFLPDRIDPAAYAATGAFAMMSVMMVGYLIVWAWWWIVRSRG